MYVCMYVCLSVTGLRLKYTGLHIVYVPLRHVPLMMIEDSEDTGRGLHQNESSCMETVNCSTKDKRMKDDKITATRNDLCVSTRAIYFAQ